MDDVTFSADRAKLKLILDNLISNAVKFTPDGGTITVRGRLDDSDLVIDVGDTGPGIPPEERAKIFEAFYQGATPHSGLVRGTGIGLSVVQEFVQAHGGTIEIVDGRIPGGAFPGAVAREQLTDLLEQPLQVLHQQAQLVWISAVREISTRWPDAG